MKLTFAPVDQQPARSAISSFSPFIGDVGFIIPPYRKSETQIRQENSSASLSYNVTNFLDSVDFLSLKLLLFFTETRSKSYERNVFDSPSKIETNLSLFGERCKNGHVDKNHAFSGNTVVENNRRDSFFFKHFSSAIRSTVSVKVSRNTIRV